MTIPRDNATSKPPTGEESPLETNKPIGDAIPTPVEPGLDQPLPEKSDIPPQKPPAHGKSSSATEEPIGDPDPRPGVPEPGPSDFA